MTACRPERPLTLKSPHRPGGNVAGFDPRRLHLSLSSSSVSSVVGSGDAAGLSRGRGRGRSPTSAADHPSAAHRLGSVVSGDAHFCACVLRGEARDHVQCDAPRFCGIPSKWNIERHPMASGPPAALTSIGSRECDESLHLGRGLNFEFHARSIGPYLRDGRSR